MHPIFAFAALAMLQPADKDNGTEVTDADFYATTRAGDRVEPTDRILYRPGDSCWEWVVYVEPVDRERSFTEVLRLPAPAPDWTSEDTPDFHVQVAPDRPSASVQHGLAAGENEIGGSWCIAAGDPLGDYRITVSEGEREIMRFDFHVVPDEADPTI